MMRYLPLPVMAAAAALAAYGQLAEGKNVYVLPMSGGLDQYLALRLVEERLLQVVADPQKADLVLTDRIGAAFEQTLTDLYAPPKIEAESKLTDSFAAPPMRPLSRSRGTIFLVDRNTRDVLWSTFEEPESSDPKELNKSARRIVDRLMKAVKSD